MTRPTLTENHADPGGGRSVTLSRVSKDFLSADGNRVRAVDTVTLDIPAQQFVAVIGPSGCGKSTLLRLVGGLLDPDQGQVLVDGALPRPGLGTGFVFQNFRLLPWRTVAGNVSLPLEASASRRGDRKAQVRQHLERVGLGAWSGHYPAQLSGGMRQRVALARALVTRPGLLLMDEPFASLDAQTRELMQEDLLELYETRRPTIVLVTHSVDEALLLADRIIVMGRGAVLDDVVVELPRPRSIHTLQGLPAFVSLRRQLWHHIRQLVLADPTSAFHGRGTDKPENA
jgi:NitT/TauT family transport system ATP-binding protein